VLFVAYLLIDVMDRLRVSRYRASGRILRFTAPAPLLASRVPMALLATAPP
jgi:hypothetical protein